MASARGIQFSDYLALIASRLRDFRIADCSRVRTLFPLGCVIGRSSTYIVDKRLAKALSVAWYWATLFPFNCNSLLNGLATMGHPDNFANCSGLFAGGMGRLPHLTQPPPQQAGCAVQNSRAEYLARRLRGGKLHRPACGWNTQGPAAATDTRQSRRYL